MIYYINKDHQLYRFNGLYKPHSWGPHIQADKFDKNCLEPEALAEEEHASATVLKPNVVRSRK